MAGSARQLLVCGMLAAHVKGLREAHGLPPSSSGALGASSQAAAKGGRKGGKGAAGGAEDPAAGAAAAAEAAAVVRYRQLYERQRSSLGESGAGKNA